MDARRFHVDEEHRRGAEGEREVDGNARYRELRRDVADEKCMEQVNRIAELAAHDERQEGGANPERQVHERGDQHHGGGGESDVQQRGERRHGLRPRNAGRGQVIPAEQVKGQHHGRDPDQPAPRRPSRADEMRGRHAEQEIVESPEDVVLERVELWVRIVGQIAPPRLVGEDAIGEAEYRHGKEHAHQAHAADESEQAGQQDREQDLDTERPEHCHDRARHPRPRQDGVQPTQVQHDVACELERAFLIDDADEGDENEQQRP